MKTIRELKAYLNMLPESTLDNKIIIHTETGEIRSFLPIKSAFPLFDDFYIGIDGIMANSVYQESVINDADYEHKETYDLLASKGTLILYSGQGSSDLEAAF